MKTRLFLFVGKVVQKNLSQGIIGRYLHSCMVATLEKEQSQFGGDMFGKRPIILLLCFIYLCIQLPQTSWHSNTPDSALKMLGEFDLTSGNGLAVTFWHKFDLPPGSLGTVEASTDEGITWQSVYTQTTSLPNWAQVTLDLSQFAGHKVTLAFFLQEVGAGNFASDETSEQAVSIPTPIRSTFVNAFWSISLVLLGGIGLSLVGGKRRSHYLVLCLVGTGLLTTLAGCIQVGPSPDFDYNKLDLTKGEIELVVPAEQQILTATMSPDGKWLFFMSSTDEDRLEQPGYYRHTLINLEQNQQYDLGISAARRRWVDAEHLAGNGVMLRVSDMVQWSLQSIEPPLVL